MNIQSPPTQPPHSSPSSPTPKFLHTVEDDTYLFQTDHTFLQVQFKTLSKQIFQYLQQYQKYCFLAEISSVGIKASEQRAMFQKISQLVKKEENKYLEIVVGYIEEFFMNVQFMKSQIWHYYSQIVKIYRINLLNNKNDCYQFNPNQFIYYNTVLSYLNKPPPPKQNGELKKIKNEIKQNQNQIRKKINQINDGMFVKNPFIAKNVLSKQIQSDELFNSYFKEVVTQNLGLKNCVEVNFHQGYSGVRQFLGFYCCFVIQGVKNASKVVRKYNSYADVLGSSIKLGPFRDQRREEFDMQEYEAQSKKIIKNRSILRNKIESVEISNKVVVKDEEKTDFSYLTLKEDSNKFKYSEKSQLQTRIPANNPYIDIWDNIYDRDRLRKLHLFHQNPKLETKAEPQQPQFQQRLHQILAVNHKNKQNTITKQYVYSELLAKQKNEQQLLFSKNQQNFTKRISSFKNYSLFSEKQVQNQLQLKLQQQRILKEYKKLTQKQRKQEEESVMQLRKSDTKNGNALYLEFLKKFAIKDEKNICEKGYVYRYGIRVQRDFFGNTDTGKLEEFLCCFLREKLYRENTKYQQRNAMPLILNTKPPQQFCNSRVIKKLGQLTQSMKKYFVWACDVIKYQEITTIDKQKIGKFTIYSYSDQKLSNSILFELKRRLNIRITGQIIKPPQKTFPILTILDKLHLLHRLIFTNDPQHWDPNVRISEGLHLYNLILKQIGNDG